MNQSFREKNEDNPSHTNLLSQLSSDGEEASIIKTEVPHLGPDVLTYVRFLESMSREKIEGIASRLRQTSKAKGIAYPWLLR